jgi:hypothetical protein
MFLAAGSDVSQQTLLEHYLIGNLMLGLRKTLAWQVTKGEFARKLSTLRFMAQCFNRHLGRMMDLEENDGYVDLVQETCPWLGRRVDALRDEHGRIRDAAQSVVTHLEQLRDADWPGFCASCNDMADLIERVEGHTRKEVALVQEAFDQEIGGEG